MAGCGDFRILVVILFFPGAISHFPLVILGLTVVILSLPVVIFRR